jgi:hypothetical protein
LVIFVGVAVNVPSLQIFSVIAMTDGLGLTVTVTVNVAPVQEPDVGVTVYTTSIAALVVLVNVPLMLASAVPTAVPVMPTTEGAVHEYVVPVGTIPLVVFAGVDVNVPSLQIVAVIADTAGFGLTVTVTVNVAPTQVPEVGVTVYTTFIAALVVFVNVPLIFAAAMPAVVPVMPGTEGTAHE